MSINDTTFFVQDYNSTLRFLLQQKPSRLRQACDSGNHTGTGASPIDQVGKVEMLDVLDRFAPMPRVDAPTDRRWVSPFDSDLPQLFDKFDQLRMLVDPKSKASENGAYAANRKLDSRIGAAFFAGAATGVTGGATTNFDTTNQVVGVSTGGTTSNLNVAKLEAGRKILLANEVDLEAEAIWVAITATEHQSLMNEIQVVSLDFNQQPVYNDRGLIQSWRGFNFIHTELPWLTTTATDDAAGSSKALPMWVKSGMYLGMWSDIKTTVSQRNDLRGEPWQVYTTLTANATRVEEKRVVKIWCR